ncbi:GNAT family N-acetyltransferase [Planctomonas sp. JC2975]|uniref:GNAT family N-acetyltransferase n=1 Tax=Planctomonas sp. JC2975 TaxID=2729626 RepID=UPI0014738629|nr:GNAT family N-acetyltransferase [Planctomonas sp. JC2975]NNC10832.1 GNAT family N-acetyltransferase [Planctomonas sp. JC2975]
MGITIREPAEGDFFSWLALYEDYATYYERALTDQGALLVWSWLTDAARAERGLVAVDDDGALIGLVHYHEVPRPLDGDHALHIDDLFVLEEHREQGFGRALIEAVATVGAEFGTPLVQWLAKQDDPDARSFYDEIADASTVVVYRLRSAQQAPASPASADAPSVEPVQTGDEAVEATDDGATPDDSPADDASADAPATDAPDADASASDASGDNPEDNPVDSSAGSPAAESSTTEA